MQSMKSMKEKEKGEDFIILFLSKKEVPKRKIETEIPIRTLNKRETSKLTHTEIKLLKMIDSKIEEIKLEMKYFEQM